MLDHFERSVGPRRYAGSGEAAAIAVGYRRALRLLLARWPELDITDERARP